MSQRLIRLTLTCLSYAAVAHADDGALDTSFSDDGIVASNFGTGFRAATTVSALPDGELLAAGMVQSGSNFDIQIIRYHANGFVNGFWGEFGGQTFAIDRMTDGFDEPLAIVPAASGAVTLLASAADTGTFRGGSTISFPVLIRLSTSGDPDVDFGVGGVITPATHPWNGTIDVVAAAAHLDGFLFFGTCTDCGPGDTSGYFLYRALGSGAPDPAFDSDGWLALSDPAFGQSVKFAVDPAGRIVLAGDFLPQFGDPEIHVSRRLASGGPDLSFSGDGTAIHTYADAVQWTPQEIGFDPVDGGVVVGLQRAAGLEAAAISLLRFSATGTFDAAFAQPVLAYQDGTYVHALEIDGKRRIYVGGTFDGTGAQFGGFYFARRLANGAADTTFDFDGRQVVEVDTVVNGWDEGLALTLSGGLPVAAGHSETESGGQRFALVRLTNSLIFADGFGLGSTWAW